MPKIVTIHDPEGMSGRTIDEVPAGARLLDWLIDRYGPDGFDVPTRVFRGEVTTASEINLDDHAEDGCPIRDDETIVIWHQPADPVTIIIAVVAVVAAVALAPDIAPPPAIPEQEKVNESPNNSLTGQTNIARPLQRIPDIYGRNKVWPDLGAKTYTEFVNHVKFVTEFLVIGRGEYLVEDVKSGETLIDDIDGATYEIFEPFNAPSELLDITEANTVDGQEISSSSTTKGFIIDIVSWIPHTAFFTYDSQVLQLNTDLTPNVSTVGVSGSVNSGSWVFQGAIPDSGGYLVFLDESTGPIINGGGPDNGAAVYYSALAGVGPFNVPGGTEEIWCDFQFPRGLADRTGGGSATRSVTIEITLQRLDGGGSPLGPSEVTNHIFQDNTLDPRFYTIKLIPDTPGDPYRVSVARLTSESTDAAMYEQCKWTRLAGVQDVSVTDFGNVTTVLVKTRATEQATRRQERRFNSVVTRKLRSYNTGTGMITPALTATTKMADAMLEHLTNSELGGKSDTEIDLDGLYTIQDALDADVTYGDKLGRFSYSFSDSRVSVGDELKTIANSCRCFVYRVGSRIFFGRDEIRPIRSGLLNPRNKKPDSETKTIRWTRPSDFDGVELQWVEEDSNDAEVIIFPEPPADPPVNPKRISAAGIKAYEQAWNRAKVEYLKLLYSRVTVETSVTREGQLIPLGGRVANVDGTNTKGQGGEVTDQSGTTITTSEPIDFKGNGTGVVVLRDDTGQIVEEISVTPRGDGGQGFVLDSLPSFTITIRGDGGNQIGTLYNFFVVNDATAKDYIVQKILPATDGYVKLNLTNYAPEVYAPDSETPTPRS